MATGLVHKPRALSDSQVSALSHPGDDRVMRWEEQDLTASDQVKRADQARPLETKRMNGAHEACPGSDGHVPAVHPIHACPATCMLTGIWSVTTGSAVQDCR